MLSDDEAVAWSLVPPPRAASVGATSQMAITSPQRHAIVSSNPDSSDVDGQSRNERHPGTPLGGERPIRGGCDLERRPPRSTPRRVWTRRPGALAMEEWTAAGSFDRVPAMPNTGALPLAETTASTDVIDAPMPNSQDSVFSFGVLSVPGSQVQATPPDTQTGSQDSALAAETERVLCLNAGDGGFATAPSSPVGGIPSSPIRTPPPIRRRVDDAPTIASSQLWPPPTSGYPSGTTDEAIGSEGGHNGRERRHAETNAVPAAPQTDATTNIQGASALFQAPANPNVNTNIIIREGFLRCPFCVGFTTRSAGGLTRHMTSRHNGTPIGAGPRQTLTALERGICATPTCCVIRPFSSRRCARCWSTAPPREMVQGDRIAGVSGPALADLPAISPDEYQQAEVAPSGTDVLGLRGSANSSGPSLPADFCSRVKALSPETLVHIPKQYRARMAAITIQTLEGMLNGVETWSMLEEARNKLLLGPVSSGEEAQQEVKLRIEWWAAGAFEDLLNRAELYTANRARKRRKGTMTKTQRAGKARRQAAEGAYRKAVGSLTSDIADLDPAQQRAWARELLPHTTRTGGRHFSAAPTPAAASDENSFDQQPGTDRADHPLRGVRFAALSAPGPSGARPEHLKEMLSSNRRALSNRLLGLVGRLMTAAKRGELPAVARWILRSRLIFIKKKASTKPRPIRVGEFWRRSIAKKIVRQEETSLRKQMLEARQFGVAIPGGAEALLHFRGDVEDLIREGVIRPLVVLDLDLANAYGSLEWDSQREAYTEGAPRMQAWEDWCSAQPTEVVTPAGDTILTDRGAEQGDPAAAAKCGLTLKKVMLRVAQTAEANNQRHSWMDTWFIDDGQIFIDPEGVDPFLQLVDAKLDEVGASRSRGVDCKSVARLVAPDGYQDDGQWATIYVRDTCKVTPNGPAHEVLGGTLGSDRAIGEAIDEIVKKAASLREKITEIDDTATELILLRLCADVSKLTYSLRVQGDRIPSQSLQRFDEDLKASLEKVLGDSFEWHSWAQACTGVIEGGLGFRCGDTTALPAFIASRVENRPGVQYLAEHFERSTLALATTIMLKYDARTSAAVTALTATLPAEDHDKVRVTIASTAESASKRWDAFVSGGEPDSSGGDLPFGRRPGAALVPDAGSEDHEHSRAWGKRSTGLQSQLNKITDDRRLEGLSHDLETNRDWEHVRRINDLRDPTVDHRWLWALSNGHGLKMTNEEYALAIRIRLGCRLFDDAEICPMCKTQVLDPAGYHTTCCAKGESTRGHNAVRDELFDCICEADPAAETEPLGLVEHRPYRRPADILTGCALLGTLASLDMCIASPHASAAGRDCCNSAVARKMDEYADDLPALEQQGIQYVPLAWSCYGREHERVSSVMTNVARRAARRKGMLSHARHLARFRQRIGLVIWRRLARMAMAVAGAREDP